MGKKNLFLRIILLLMVVGVGFIAFRSAGAASEPEIGPYTEIQLPLEDLPALPEDQVYNPVVELTSGEPSRPTVSLPDDHSLDDRATAVAHFPQESLTGPYLQVLYVLEDPREVPLARYAYNNSDGVVKPVADMEQLAGHSLKTINVYVKVQNLNSQPLTDPLIASEHTDTSWPALYVSPLSLELRDLAIPLLGSGVCRWHRALHVAGGDRRGRRSGGGGIIQSSCLCTSQALVLRRRKHAPTWRGPGRLDQLPGPGCTARTAAGQGPAQVYEGTGGRYF